MENSNLTKEQITFSTESPSILLWQLNTIWQNKKKDAINSVASLSILQYSILVNLNWLTTTNQEVTQVQLAAHLGMETMNVSQALKILERDGYILRQAHSVDTRAKSVLLSPKGIDITVRISEQITTAETSFFKILGDDINAFKAHITTLINQ